MITWIINSMESTPSTGIVVSANWSCIAQQDSYSVELSGVSMFPPPGQNFTPYDNLTEGQVLDWCWTVGGLSKDTVEASAQTGLEQQINPSVVQNPLPWST